MTGLEILSLAEGLNPNFVRGSSNTINLAWLNRVSTEFYEAAYMTDAKRYIKEATVTLVSGTSDYTFADISVTDFESIKPQNDKDAGLPKDGVLCGLFKFDENEAIENYKQTGRGSTDKGFYLGADISGDYDKISITPDPSVAEDLIFRYVPTIPELTALSENIFLPFPRKFQFIYVDYLSVLSAKSQTAEQGEIAGYEFDRDALVERFTKEFNPRKSNVISI